jgi:hypothetical protein
VARSLDDQSPRYPQIIPTESSDAAAELPADLQFGLAAGTFTLENTEPTTVHFLPGMATTLPLAVLSLLVAGIGATAAWIFAVWSGVVKKVVTIQENGELEAQQVRIQELDNDL